MPVCLVSEAGLRVGTAGRRILMTRSRRNLLEVPCCAQPLTRILSTEAKADKKRGLFFHKEMHVPSFGGSVRVRSPFDVRVHPLGAHEYPNLDRAFVRLRTEATPQNIDGRKNTNTEVDQDGATLVVSTSNAGVPTELCRHVKKEVQVPMVYSVQVEATGRAAAEVAELIEADFCRVRSQEGDVEVAKVKASAIEVESDSGDVTCRGNIQGAVKIKTKSGNVIGDKRFTGETLEVSTDSGDIRIASSYADSSSYYTNSGSLYLRNIHNDCYMSVYEKGNVTLLGMDGSANIFVKKGDVDCQVSVVRNESRIHVEEGDIHLRVSDDQPLKLLIDANDIIPDTKFKSLGKVKNEEGDAAGRKRFECLLHPNQFAAELVVKAENGTVVLESQDWAASLGLKLAPPPLPKS